MIPVFRPSMGDEECDAVSAVLRSGWIGLGPRTKEFEERFADYLGVRYAVAVNSATAALHLAAKALNLEGAEVVTTPMTFVSTNHALLYVGAEPVFCDIEPDTLNLDAAKIEALVTSRTKAVMVVHYGGYAADMDRILDIARRRKLLVIEDCAHACGGEHRGRKLGAIGDIGCFSFHAVKNLATGDGGMVTTNDEAVYRRLMKLRWLGITKDTWSRESGDSHGYSWYYNVEELGYKCHMNDITAAIGLVQLAKLDAANARRRALTERYNRALAGLSEVETPVRRDYMTMPASHNYVIRCSDRDGLHEALKAKGISTGVHYIPNNHYEMYRKFRGATPVCDAVWKRLLTLPLFPDLSDEEADRVAAAVVAHLRAH